MSGDERLVKPDPALFQHPAAPEQHRAVAAVFIDDTMRNVEAANALGLHGIHFTSPEALGARLTLGISRRSGDARRE